MVDHTIHSYKSAIDNRAYFVSIIVIGMVLSAFTMFFLEGTFNVVVTSFSVILLVFCSLVLLRPFTYLISEKNLIIKRLFRSYSLPLKDIKSVTIVQQRDMNTSIRAGNFGLFGYTGTYVTNDLGVVTLYASQWRNFVAIKDKKGKVIVVAPKDPDGFYDLLYTKLHTITTI